MIPTLVLTIIMTIMVMTRATVIINLRQRETSLLKHDIYKTAFLLFLLFVYFCLLLFVLFCFFVLFLFFVFFLVSSTQFSTKSFVSHLFSCMYLYLLCKKLNHTCFPYLFQLHFNEQRAQQSKLAMTGDIPDRPAVPDAARA